jgi:hypothetical protein
MMQLIPTCSIAGGGSELTPFHIMKMKYGVQLSVNTHDRAQTVVTARLLLLSMGEWLCANALNLLEARWEIVKRTTFMIAIATTGTITTVPKENLNRKDAPLILLV